MSLRAKFAVVVLSLFCVAENGISFADFDEALARGWIIGIDIRVMGFGEGIEGSGQVVVSIRDMELGSWS